MKQLFMWIKVMLSRHSLETRERNQLLILRHTLKKKRILSMKKPSKTFHNYNTQF